MSKLKEAAMSIVNVDWISMILTFKMNAEWGRIPITDDVLFDKKWRDRKHLRNTTEHGTALCTAMDQ